MAVKQVTCIPAKINMFNSLSLQSNVKKRVAAYARVSTDSEEQLSSYEAQVRHYTNHIKSNEDWEFVEVYTDEGITGVNTKRRDGFNRMINDALDGKIDLIITKSVSRFARNTVDTLTTVRKLKEKGVEVYFEKENVYTLDSKGEVMLTIMSSLAQEESRSISENVAWGKRKRFSEGIVSLPYGHFLGYEKGEDGLPKVVEKEAETIKLIYKLFLEGKTPYGIRNHLMEKGILSPCGKEKWYVSTIRSILTNEKYKGDAMLQKCFTVDFLTKKKKVNEGEIPQYYVKHSHPAIISPELFDLVQAEIKKREEAGGRHSGINCFSSKIICGDCGSFYGSKTLHSTDKYKRFVWQCNNKFKNDKKCETPILYDNNIKTAFIYCFNRLLGNKETVKQDCADMINLLKDTSNMDKEIESLTIESENIYSKITEMVNENAEIAIDQNLYNIDYAAYRNKYEEIKIRIAKIENEKDSRIKRIQEIERYLNELTSRDKIITEFDETLWHTIIEKVTTRHDGTLTFTFKDGFEIKV